jgi:ketosteroid isomerase-like protein
VTHDDVSDWLHRYVDAWHTYDREQIADLFSEDAVCRYHPYDPPVTGRAAVVESWLGEGNHEGAPDPDAPGTWEAEYSPFAVDGQIAVATGRTYYREQPGGEIKRVYHNCFLMRFDDEGRCAEFTEWFMLEPDA